MTKMTPKRAAFIREYMIDRNGTQAAIRAGYSKHTANVIASQLLREPTIMAEVEQRSAAVFAKLDVTLERVIEELAAIGFADLRELYDENGNLRPLHELDGRAAASIAGVDVEEEWTGEGENRRKVGRVTKLKRFDKTPALLALGRHLGMRQAAADPPPPQASFPGLTVIVQQGVAVEGQRVVQQQTRVAVNLPPPE